MMVESWLCNLHQPHPSRARCECRVLYGFALQRESGEKHEIARKYLPQILSYETETCSGESVSSDFSTDGKIFEIAYRMVELRLRNWHKPDLSRARWECRVLYGIALQSETGGKHELCTIISPPNFTLWGWNLLKRESIECSFHWW